MSGKNSDKSAKNKLIGGKSSLPPLWCQGKMEKPKGEKNMGSWTAAVYTSEQQKRLGVDEFGKKK